MAQFLPLRSLVKKKREGTATTEKPDPLVILEGCQCAIILTYPSRSVSVVGLSADERLITRSEGTSPELDAVGFAARVGYKRNIEVRWKTKKPSVS